LQETRPIVSACIISYNQEHYIAQAIEGALMQELDVPYEIVISDDCSTDKTPEIIREYAKKDARIRIVSPASNLGMHGNWRNAIIACNGTWVALCEGDDLWTDPLKLQKQLNVVSNSASTVGCFSNASVLKPDGAISEYDYVSGKGGITANAFFAMNSNPIPTCTLLFNREAFIEFPDAYYASPFADWILHSLLLQEGNYAYLNEKTSTYRQHGSGLWTGVSEEKQLINKLKVLKIIRSIMDSEYKALNNSAIRNQLDALLYFYRGKKAYLKFLSTWIQLKTL
jgi:glycosyltransferase involved in cell wall biosynthesis